VIISTTQPTTEEYKSYILSYALYVNQTAAARHGFYLPSSAVLGRLAPLRVSQRRLARAAAVSSSSAAAVVLLLLMVPVVVVFVGRFQAVDERRTQRL